LLDGHVVAPGKLKVGQCEFTCEGLSAANGHVRAYLRPEDIVARPIEPGDANVLAATIEKIEFLGPYCLVRANAAGLDTPLTVYLSLNYLSEQSLTVGSRLPLKVLTERLRVFAD
jgi:iron(III) transport system ATP-binding protein